MTEHDIQWQLELIGVFAVVAGWALFLALRR